MGRMSRSNFGWTVVVTLLAFVEASAGAAAVALVKSRTEQTPRAVQKSHRKVCFIAGPAFMANGITAKILMRKISPGFESARAYHVRLGTSTYLFGLIQSDLLSIERGGD
jgi:hypothetical protein